MDKERLLMDQVMESFFSKDIDPHFLDGNTEEEILKRWSVLRYGFGSRTHSQLSEAFSGFRKIIGNDLWQVIGKDFSDRHGSESEYLGDLVTDFFDHIGLSAFDPKEERALIVDYLKYQSQRSSFSQDLGLSDLSILTEDSKIQLQTSCMIFNTINDAVLVCRDADRFYVETIDIDLSKNFSSLSSEQNLSHWATKFSNEKSLSDALVMAQNLPILKLLK
ncbi:MAG: hypothetical protein AB8E15_00855 [Bdellovibrionales bacterium]